MDLNEQTAHVDEQLNTASNDVSKNRSRSDEVLDLIAGVEQQLEQMKTTQAARVDAIAGMENRQEAITARERELEHVTDALVEREAQLEERIARAMVAEQALEDRRTGLDHETEELARRETTAQERENGLEERDTAINETQLAIDAERTEIECERTAIAAQQESFNDERSAIEADWTEAQARFEATQETLVAREAECGQLSERITQLELECTHGVAQVTERDDTIQTIRNEAIALTTQLSEAADTLAASEQECADVQGALELATDRLRALSSAIAEQAPHLEEGAAAIALAQQQEVRVLALTEELSALQAKMEFASNTECASDSTIQDARAELEHVNEQLAFCEATLRESQERQAALETENEELSEQATFVQCNSDDGNGDASRLRDQAERLAAFATHLQRRRFRLRGLRNAIGTRGRSDTSDHVRNSIHGDRLDKAAGENLVRRQSDLAEMETRMMRRWAKQRAVGVATQVGLAIVVLAAVSFFGVRFFAPGPVTASALIEAHAIAGGTIDDERATAWNTWHTSVLSEQAFAEKVAARLGSQSAGFEGGAPAVTALIDKNLQVETVQPGLLKLSFNGESQGEAVRLLESIVSSLANESQRQLPRRGDGARAKVIPQNGQLVAVAPIPVTQSQVQTAGMVFGGSFIGFALIGAIGYASLSRSQRVFDESVGFGAMDRI